MTDEEELEELEYLRLKAKAAQGAKTAPAYDPSKGLDIPASAPRGPLSVGAGETFLNKTGEALPLGRQVSSSLGAMLLSALQPHHGVRLTPQAAAELGTAQEAPSPGLAENYRKIRDSIGERTEAGAQQNPKAALAGAVLGTGLSLAAPLPKVSVGSGAAGRVLSNALTAGAYGAVNGAANSRGDLTKGEVGQVLKDAVGVEGLQRAAEDAKAGKYGRAALDVAGAGGLGGLATGGVLGATIEGGKAALSPLSEPLRRMALNQGRRVLTNGADSLSRRAPVSEAAVEEAIRSGAIKPFSNTEATATRLGDLTESAGDKYGEVVAQLEARGVKGPDARKVADQLLQTGGKLERQTMNNALPKEYLEQASNLLGKAGPGGELELTQAENLKRSLQRQAKYGRVEDTELNGVRKDVASVLRQANEDAISKAAGAAPQDAELQKLAGDFVPAKERLGRLIEAESAAERGAARGAQRGHFGLKQTAHAAAAVASGHAGLAVPAAMASHFLQNRAPSAAASYGLTLADLLRGAAPEAAPSSGKVVELLSNALGNGRGPVMAPQMALTDKQKQEALAQALAGGSR